MPTSLRRWSHLYRRSSRTRALLRAMTHIVQGVAVDLPRLMENPAGFPQDAWATPCGVAHKLHSGYCDDHFKHHEGLE
jgi:hypothetical protein